MNDATKAPERIWANYKEANRLYVAYDMPPRDEFDDCRDPYILATPAALAASPEVAALLAAAILDAQLRCMERGRIDTPNEIRTAAAIRAEAAALRGEKEPK